MKKTLVLIIIFMDNLCFAKVPSFQGLGGMLPDQQVHSAMNISADGLTVVGHMTNVAGLEACRWTKSGGWKGFGDLPGSAFQGEAYGVSADGSVAVGYSKSTASGDNGEAFRWTEDGGMVGLGDLPGGSFSSHAYNVSADGSVVVGMGFSVSDDYWGFEAFRWTQSEGMVGLGDLPGGASASEAFGISSDGFIIVGYANTFSGSEAFRWEAGVMTGLGDLPGGDFESHAKSVSSDGSTVAGYSSSSSGTEAFRWTLSEGMQGLGDLPGGFFSSYAFDVSGDGSIVVGISWTELGNQAFIWDIKNGMRNLKDVLENDYSLNLTGWQLDGVAGISDDGLIIAGTGINPNGNGESWIATIPEPTTLSLLTLGGMALLRKRNRQFDIHWSTHGIPPACRLGYCRKS